MSVFLMRRGKAPRYIKLITFSVYGPLSSASSFTEKTYNAIEGMTWSEWLASEYNTDNALCERDLYLEFSASSGYGVGVDGTWEYELVTNTIKPNTRYVAIY
jgi:hypothetical protein